jgi:hypothetical protein
VRQYIKQEERKQFGLLLNQHVAASHKTGWLALLFFESTISIYFSTLVIGYFTVCINRATGGMICLLQHHISPGSSIVISINIISLIAKPFKELYTCDKSSV